MTAQERGGETQERSPASIPVLPFGRYHALVVGNNAYRHLPRLETAVADAREIAATLRRDYGFEVTALENADRYQILSSLNRLRSELGESDNLLVYYAGHGDLDRANARGHWLPVDAEPTSTANWISNVAITDVLNAMAARHVLVIADSCYSGTLTRSSLGQLGNANDRRAREAWMKAILPKRSRTALSSGALQPVLDGLGGRHSVFAASLLRVLRSNQAILGGQELHQAVAAEVTLAAADVRFDQVPQYAPIRFAGHESGDFLLVRRP